MASKISVQALGYVRIIILAHLLAPLDFGLMGIGMVVIAALETITLPGFEEALVQRKGDVEGHLDTLWTLSISRALVIVAVLALGAPLLAAFFNSPDAVRVIQALAGAAVLRGLVNPGILYFRRDLEFHKKFLNDFGPALAEIVVAISAALVLQNVWALVLAFLGGRVIQVGVSYWSHPYRPRFSLGRSQAKDLFAFGRWVYLTRIVVFVSTQSDNIILTKLFGPATLGLYQMGHRTASVPLMELHRGVSAVAFPLYARIQDDSERLKRGFLIGVEAVGSLSIPLAVSIFVLAPEFVNVALGDKWLLIVPVMRVLVVSSCLHSLSASSGGQLFNGIGKPWLAFQMNLIRAITVVTAVFPLAANFGPVGAAYAVLIASALGFAFYLYHSFSILRYGVLEYFKALFPAGCAGFAVASVGIGAKQVLGAEDVAGFVFTALVVAASYAGVFGILSWKFKIGLLASARGMLS